MTQHTVNGTTLMQLGLKGKSVGLALHVIRSFEDTLDAELILEAIEDVIRRPGHYVNHEVYGPLAYELDAAGRLARAKAADTLRGTPLPYTTFGAHLIPENAHEQMRVAMRLPIDIVGGALMPDAHKGYGLPIGGVFATRGVILPYAVGVDIGCSMMQSVTTLQVTPSTFDSGELRERLITALTTLTRFGAGGTGFGEAHEVLDDADAWQNLPRELRHLRDKAAAQIGTQGGGNHFAEFGEYTSAAEPDVIHLALLSHFGSRGVGAQIANHYTKLAMKLHPHLPKEAQHLAWLDMTAEGAEYFHAMQLAGRFALAGHEILHRRLLTHLGLDTQLQVSNSHNLAWDEDGVITHRKGATPADAGRLGIIPGSMADSAWTVAGLGNPASLNSASHGAGRQLGRNQAMAALSSRPDEVEAYLTSRGVTKLGGGLDEHPLAYKRIEEVILAQADLVDIVGRFQPRIVMMANDEPKGKQPKDPSDDVNPDGE
ncbi:RtcB family protein [Deinococcus soli (ex Cha et al. 2016)]|uniref:3'-phosphate/5'-hydroxy nucleic acid ligase n=2 Tax=Deinococcus soli (ex Cha et al. 2016) TaxID=1309411 RepID=A0AAE3XBS1_9DEIO|nr:RtcB family protein [Deinococcus soli (ex Cha et al. 2016)]MDR6218131.1 tRNA-splicing ligase RtcB [Deinococcus soli (ex Cha et al. 2016)]MDR6328871.1 tRNA-splicing ligase RtcB [Deinococcus soli (ex Cha et al. 2016)]MDR6751641.1 tRNA-splicing ligase RtcB [Deinococcus soli (ex Cha et al. 2016)]